jgi:hypothetical protein
MSSNFSRTGPGTEVHTAIPATQEVIRKIMVSLSLSLSLSIHLSIYIYTYTYTYLYIYTYICLYIHIYICIYVNINVINIYINMYAYIYINIRHTHISIFDSIGDWTQSSHMLGKGCTTSAAPPVLSFVFCFWDRISGSSCFCLPSSWNYGCGAPSPV